jgi:hypothetical protein
MARLTEQEKQDIVRYLEADKPLPDKVFICEGESDTWTALSYGSKRSGRRGRRASNHPGSRASVDCKTRTDGQLFIWSWTLTQRALKGR